MIMPSRQAVVAIIFTLALPTLGVPALAAVNPGPPKGETPAAHPGSHGPAQPAPKAAVSPGPVASANPRAAAIEVATFPAAPDTGASPATGASNVLIKVQVLLDRAHMSPGVIDGRGGGNLTNAVTAYEKSHGLPAEPAVGAALLARLTKDDGAPITQDYRLTAADEAGPFIGKAPLTLLQLSKLKAAGYADSVEEMAERFHMSQELLRALNPGAVFTAAGTVLLVTRPGLGVLPGPVTRVEVDKAANQVRALDAGGKILAAYPATVGSTERPAPSGTWAVRAVASHPDYTYDPKRLTFGNRGQGVLTIAPGPHNPVGTTWIALTKPTYGIHGSPDPNEVGKTASHGCVRLTNWDAAALGKAVKKGVPVVFLGETTKS
jgi:lipoprotein-anchoring transpeptidase ErfK/SrfK